VLLRFISECVSRAMIYGKMLIRANGILIRANEVIISCERNNFRVDNMLSRADEMLIRANEVLFRANKILFRANVLLFRAKRNRNKYPFPIRVISRTRKRTCSYERHEKHDTRRSIWFQFFKCCNGESDREM
jgi:hypothetical protein